MFLPRVQTHFAQALGLDTYYTSHEFVDANLRCIVTCILKQLAESGMDEHVFQVIMRHIIDMEGERIGGATADALPDAAELDTDLGAANPDDISVVQYDRRRKRFRFDFQKDVQSRVLEDYMHRGDELDTLTLWEMLTTYTRDEIGKRADGGQGNRILFRDNHPAASTHALRPFRRPRIPVLNGFGMLPRRATEPELHALIALSLFVPWRTAPDILAGAGSFAERFNQPNILPMWAQAIVRNWAEWTRAVSETGMSRTDMLRKQHDPDLERNQPVFQPAADAEGDVDVAMDDNDDDGAGLNDAVGAPTPTAASVTARTLKALSHATDCMLIGGPATASGSFTTPRAVRMVDTDVRTAIKSTMDRYAAAATAAGTIDDDEPEKPAFGTIVPILAAAARAFPLDRPPETVHYDAAAVRAAVDGLQHRMSVVDAFGQPRPVRFNQQQRFAISIAAAHVLHPSLPPLRMCVIGDAGCGKTVFAKAFRQLLEQHGRSDELRIMAWTGSAARTAGGQTVCTALCIGPFTRTPLCSNQVADKLRRSFANVKYVIFDEVSLLSTRVLVLVDHRLRVAKGNDVVFGGLHVFFVGDHYQLGPVSDKSLFVPVSCEEVAKQQLATTTQALRDASTALASVANAKDKEKKTIAKEQKRKVEQLSDQLGRLLWITAPNAVVLFTENMRANPDERSFVELLKRVRAGVGSVEDHRVLSNRALTAADVEREPDRWLYATCLTSTNELVQHLGALRLQRLATYSKQRIITWKSK